MNNEILKTYDVLINNYLNSKDEKKYISPIKYNINKEEFINYLKLNIKKSTFLAQILPLFLFLIISLVSFSLVILSQNIENLGLIGNDESLKFCIMFFESIFFILFVCILIQRVFFKIRVIRITQGYRKGYRNISYKKIQSIINFLNEL